MTGHPRAHRPPWGRCQFSLRSAFVAVLAVSLWMGCVVHRAHEQQLAVKVIRQSGGTVFYDDELSGDAFVDYAELHLPGKRHWLAPLVGQDLVARVIHVSFKSPRYDGRVIRWSRSQKFPVPDKCNGIYPNPMPEEMLHVNDDTIHYIASLHHLRWLLLAETDIDDSALEQFGSLDHLEVLELGNDVSEAGFNRLRAYTTAHCNQLLGLSTVC